MDNLKMFSEHLKRLTENQWNTLFDLIPEIENTEDFGFLEESEEIFEGVFTMPEWVGSTIVQRVEKIVYELKLIYDFDWSEWEAGKIILNDPNQDFNALDTVTLCKLLTTIVRADRLHDGFLVANFKNGTILKIINALKQN